MIVVLACAEKKHQESRPAIDLYKSSHYSCRRSLARALVDDRRIFILSAKWGLIRSSQVIPPYEMRLGDEGSVTKQKVAEQARRLRIAQYPAIFLGGSEYYDLCREAFTDIRAITPKVNMLRQQKWLATMRGRIEDEQP